MRCLSRCPKSAMRPARDSAAANSTSAPKTANWGAQPGERANTPGAIHGILQVRRLDGHAEEKELPGNEKHAGVGVTARVSPLSPSLSTMRRR